MEKVVKINKYKLSNGRRPISKGEMTQLVYRFLDPTSMRFMPEPSNDQAKAAKVKIKRKNRRANRVGKQQKRIQRRRA